MTDNWNNAAEELADDAKKAAENVQNAAEDTWNKVKETTSDATEAVSETIGEVQDGTQDLVEEGVSETQAQASNAWTQTADALEETVTETKEDLGKTVESASETVDGAWSTTTDHVEDAAAEVKGGAQSAWESAKESTQDEWQKATDEAPKPDPNDPSTWKQDVYAAADTVKSEAGEVIPSWESYKETSSESVATPIPEQTTPAEPVQPVVIPPTTAPYGSQAQVTPVEPARSFTTQTPAFQPQPVVKKKGLPAWAIVLMVIGALILLCVLLGVIFFGSIVRTLLQGSVPLQLVLSQFLV